MITSHVLTVALLCLQAGPVFGQELIQPPPRTLITNARIFDGRGDTLTEPMNVLIIGSTISKIAADPIVGANAKDAVVIDAGGRTLMPGLIDAHTHLMFATLPPLVATTSDIGFINVVATRAAESMLMRGFTSARDLGGPVFGLKRGIDAGYAVGPRIWPSGAMISQTGGHGDFRIPNELPSAPTAYTYFERLGATAIADNPDQVRVRSREQLALGSTQLKLMAGGGVSSNFDPLDVTQYTVEELKAAVEAAENWGTYVTVHAYTPRAVKQALDAGVKCIDHGQLLDDETAKLMAEKGVWWSLQPFIEDPKIKSAFPEGSPNRVKQLEMFAGTDKAFALAKKYKIKVAFGTDALFSAGTAARQGADLARMSRWYTPAEILKMATSGNAELLALSGKRSPYPGKLGVIEEGAMADLLIVAGNPLKDITLVADPVTNFVVIMKDGKVYKNAIR
ncbi:metal-dependent hydrolase family protein [Humisphaera borealis]|uniref:Amidohydrolase family protein n=1 Tax=Humisphaera borealis TaxID=2807512 RepID=A0A7M2WW66_9BACT|nr:amidohydrolase family protein [Humisphaera borealis]QOV89778.1 amidohydrolase family protein [Humisphaera borealis]